MVIAGQVEAWDACLRSIKSAGAVKGGGKTILIFVVDSARALEATLEGGSSFSQARSASQNRVSPPYCSPSQKGDDLWDVEEDPKLVVRELNVVFVSEVEASFGSAFAQSPRPRCGPVASSETSQ